MISAGSSILGACFLFEPCAWATSLGRLACSPYSWMDLARRGLHHLHWCYRGWAKKCLTESKS